MYYYEVAPTRIIRQDTSVLTYASPHALSIGHIVVIPVGKKSYVGLIIRETKKPPYETKEIISVVTEQPLPSQLVTLSQWIAEYYSTHLATVLQTLLPRGIQKARRKRSVSTKEQIRERTTIVLNQEQSAAVETIQAATPGTVLLHGITGSGKTAVYIELAKQTLAHGRSVIVLVPEIALTSQIVDEFSYHFDNVLLTHSRQSEAERHIVWQEALNSTTPRVAVGPRSALFMPLRNVGLIVIDEAHEPSFKQEQSPRYSALRAATVLAATNEAKVILGSATPPVSDYYLARSTKRPLVTLATRARKDTVVPSVTLIDMTKRDQFKRHRFLSSKLLSSIERAVEEGNQVLIFHNRRGSATVTLCENCGWSAACPRCFLPLTLHGDAHHLRCHVCGLTEKVPTSCPVCSSVAIIHKGIGTKLIESELQRLFPRQTIARFDGDSADDATVEARYKELYDGTISIIVGTQVIAKGLDLPKLRTVGVIQADAGLALPDFAAPERTFQLLAQVVGRVGRSHHATEVIVQSYQPTHYAVTTGLHQDYAAFYEQTIPERKRGHFPPFRYLLKLTCVYKTEAAAIRQARAVASILRQHAVPTVEILGPTPSFYERQRDTYRWQLTLKAPKRSELTALLQYLPPTHWQFELDPTSLL